MIRFEVEGIPGPQGSKKEVGKRENGSAILIESSKKVKPWRAAVALAAWRACNDLIEGAVRVEIIFYMPAPKRFPKGRMHPSVTPDIDKLTRSTLDALTDIAYKDDGQVTDLHALKRYRADGWTGAIITITQDQ